MNLKELIRDIPDFPIPGVLFRDISPLLRNPQALAWMTEQFGKAIETKKIDAFVGVESRGFILAGLLASHFGKGFIPLRKSGKLPPPLVREDYSLEYGTASLEMNPGQGNVMIVDDVLATGGTLQASINICQKAGYRVEQVAVLIDLTFLNQMLYKGEKVFSLIQY